VSFWGRKGGGVIRVWWWWWWVGGKGVRVIPYKPPLLSTQSEEHSYNRQGAGEVRDMHCYWRWKNGYINNLMNHPLRDVL